MRPATDIGPSAAPTVELTNATADHRTSVGCRSSLERSHRPLYRNPLQRWGDRLLGAFRVRHRVTYTITLMPSNGSAREPNSGLARVAGNPTCAHTAHQIAQQRANLGKRVDASFCAMPLTAKADDSREGNYPTERDVAVDKLRILLAVKRNRVSAPKGLSPRGESRQRFPVGGRDNRHRGLRDCDLRLCTAAVFLYSSLEAKQ